MKKLLFTSILFLIVIFTIKNSVILNAQSYDFDSDDLETVKEHNESRDVYLNKNFKPISKFYYRTIIHFVNGATGNFAGTHDINYTFYKYEGDYHDYYMFYYDNLAQPQSDYNSDYGYYFNGSAKTNITSNIGELVKWDPESKPKSSTSSLSIGIDGKTPSISYSIDFNHSELEISNENNVLHKKFSIEYSYNRSGFDYLFNKVPKFLWQPHISKGSSIYKVEKGQKPEFYLEFYGRMNYSKKFFDAWHTAKRRYHTALEE